MTPAQPELLRELAHAANYLMMSHDIASRAHRNTTPPATQEG